MEHPAAKSMIELSRAQDESVGDGTTSVVILAGEMMNVIRACLGTKFVSQYGDLMVGIALDAVNIVRGKCADPTAAEIDLKKYARVDKLPGGDVTESRVFHGVVLNKDVTHSKMRRRIENPRIVLLDCNLEYKKVCYKVFNVVFHCCCCFHHFHAFSMHLNRLRVKRMWNATRRKILRSC